MPGPIPGTQQSNERCQRELSLNLSQLAALTAAVASFNVDGGPCCRRWVNRLIEEQGGYRHAGDELVTLFKRGLLVEIGRYENDVFYKPTPSTVDKVRGWAGYHERATEAAE